MEDEDDIEFDDAFFSTIDKLVESHQHTKTQPSQQPLSPEGTKPPLPFSRRTTPPKPASNGGSTAPAGGLAHPRRHLFPADGTPGASAAGPDVTERLVAAERAAAQLRIEVESARRERDALSQRLAAQQAEAAAAVAAAAAAAAAPRSARPVSSAAAAELQRQVLALRQQLAFKTQETDDLRREQADRAARLQAAEAAAAEARETAARLATEAAEGAAVEHRGTASTSSPVGVAVPAMIQDPSSPAPAAAAPERLVWAAQANDEDSLDDGPLLIAALWASHARDLHLMLGAGTGDDGPRLKRPSEELRSALLERARAVARAEYVPVAALLQTALASPAPAGPLLRALSRACMQLAVSQDTASRQAPAHPLSYRRGTRLRCAVIVAAARVLCRLVGCSLAAAAAVAGAHGRAGDVVRLSGTAIEGRAEAARKPGTPTGAQGVEEKELPPPPRLAELAMQITARAPVLPLAFLANLLAELAGVVARAGPGSGGSWSSSDDESDSGSDGDGDWGDGMPGRGGGQYDREPCTTEYVGSAARAPDMELAAAAAGLLAACLEAGHGLRPSHIATSGGDDGQTVDNMAGNEPPASALNPPDLALLHLLRSQPGDVAVMVASPAAGPAVFACFSHAASSQSQLGDALDAALSPVPVPAGTAVATPGTLPSAQEGQTLTTTASAAVAQNRHSRLSLGQAWVRALGPDAEPETARSAMAAFGYLLAARRQRSLGISVLVHRGAPAALALLAHAALSTCFEDGSVSGSEAAWMVGLTDGGANGEEIAWTSRAAETATRRVAAVGTLEALTLVKSLLQHPAHGSRAADVLFGDAAALRALVQVCERMQARLLPGSFLGGAVLAWVGLVCDRAMVGTAHWTPDVAVSLARSLLKLIAQLDKERTQD